MLYGTSLSQFSPFNHSFHYQAGIQKATASQTPDANAYSAAPSLEYQRGRNELRLHRPEVSKSYAENSKLNVLA